MMSWWLNAPPQNNDITLPNTFSQSLYDVLMHQRNLAGGINYAPCRRGDMWSRSVHYTCMEKGICRKCCAKKMANIAIGPSKRNFIFYYYAVTLSDGVTRLSLNLTILPILLGKMTLFWTAIRRMLYFVFV